MGLFGLRLDDGPTTTVSSARRLAGGGFWLSAVHVYRPLCLRRLLALVFHNSFDRFTASGLLGTDQLLLQAPMQEIFALLRTGAAAGLPVSHS